MGSNLQVLLQLSLTKRDLSTLTDLLNSTMIDPRSNIQDLLTTLLYLRAIVEEYSDSHAFEMSIRRTPLVTTVQNTLPRTI